MSAQTPEAPQAVPVQEVIHTIVREAQPSGTSVEINRTSTGKHGWTVKVYQEAGESSQNTAARAVFLNQALAGLFQDGEPDQEALHAFYGKLALVEEEGS